MLFGILGRCAEATAPETQEQALGSPRTLPARLRGVGAVSIKSKHLFRGRGPFLCHSGEENCASGGQEREWGLAEGWPAGKAGGPAPPSWRGAAWSGGWGGTGSQLTARPIREKRGFVSHSVSRSASSLGSVSRLPGPGHLRALLSTPPLGQRPPAGGGKDTAPPFLSLLLAHLPLDPRRPLWWGASASPVPVQAWRWAGGSFRAGRGRVLGRGPGGALLPPRGEVRTRLPGAQTAPGSAGGSEESTLGAAGLLSREQLGPDARGWGPPSRDRGAPWGQGRSAGLSPPSQPGSFQVRGPWRRLRRTAGRVEHNTSGGSVLQGLLPSSRPRAGLSEGPTGKGGGQRVHRSAPRRDTAGERRRPGAGLRRRSWGERARGRREGAAGSWGPRSTPTPDPRAARSVLCLTQCGLVLAR